MRLLSVARGITAAAVLLSLSVAASSAQAEDLFAQRRYAAANAANALAAENFESSSTSYQRAQLAESLEKAYTNKLGYRFDIIDAYYLPQGLTYVVCGTGKAYAPTGVTTGIFIFQPGDSGVRIINISKATAQAVGCFANEYVTLR